MSNFDYKKYLVENKLTSNSRLNENESTLPSEDEIKRKGAVSDSVTVSKNGK